LFLYGNDDDSTQKVSAGVASGMRSKDLGKTTTVSHGYIYTCCQFVPVAIHMITMRKSPAAQTASSL